MTMRQPRTGNLLAMRAETGEKFDKFPAARFPVQHEIQQLQKELNDFNGRIKELENEGHSRSCDGSVEGKCNRFCTADR